MGILHHVASVLLLGASASGWEQQRRQLQTVDLDVSAQQLVDILLDSSAFATSNVAIDCPVLSFGAATFDGSIHAFVDLGIGDGENIVLSTGNATEVEEIINDSGSTSTVTGGGADADVSAATGSPTFDACSLSFDVVSSRSTTVTFSYIFMSEEYNEFVDSDFNDGFLLLVDGQNVATLAGGVPVAINNINNGDNSAMFNDNGEDNSGNFDTEYDGFTNLLGTSPFDLEAGIPSTIRIVIADAGDDGVDSSLVLQGGSFSICKDYSLSLQCPEVFVVISGDRRPVPTYIPATPRKIPRA